MIITRITNGLGNQMFQYAAGLRLAHYHRTELQLNLSKIDERPDGAMRGYGLGAFAVSGQVMRRAEFRAQQEASAGLLVRLGLRRRRRPRTPGDERQYHFEPRVLTLPDGTHLKGLWQSERYFEDATDAVREEFSWKEPPRGNNAALAEQIAGCRAVSLHVRRGDYVTYAVKRLGLCPLDYYRRAVTHVQERVTDPTFFLFSDEPDWVRENLELDAPSVVVDHNGVDAGAEDLRLMSLCGHHIIANSTFSWWGAWLDPSPDKVVVAPKRWFVDGASDTSDLIPPGWVRL